jgi:hypothetical protein
VAGLVRNAHLPIDSVTIRFVTSGPAEPVLDYETRASKADENGLSLFNAHLFAVAAGSRRAQEPRRVHADQIDEPHCHLLGEQGPPGRLVQGRKDRNFESDGRPMVCLLLGVVAVLDLFEAYG